MEAAPRNSKPIDAVLLDPVIPDGSSELVVRGHKGGHTAIEETPTCVIISTRGEPNDIKR
jgi:hypothetical protein